MTRGDAWQLRGGLGPEGGSLSGGSAKVRPEPRAGPHGNGGTLSVQVVPDGSAALPFVNESPDTWTFQGDTSALVGRSYSVRLENGGRSRVKVVIAVNGVNVYVRKPIAGTADRDVGSILGPGQTRVVTGLQSDEQTAQRFVFKPGPSPRERSAAAPGWARSRCRSTKRGRGRLTHWGPAGGSRPRNGNRRSPLPHQSRESPS